MTRDDREFFSFMCLLASTLMFFMALMAPLHPKPSPTPIYLLPSVPTAQTQAPTIDPDIPFYDVDEEANAQAYMRSPERIAGYESFFQNAGTRIAQELDSGRLGPVFRYNDYKVAKSRGYTGWGGISTLDNRFYAWVWWNADGSIDWSSVQGFALSNGATTVQMEKPRPDSIEYYEVFYHVDGKPTRVTNTHLDLNDTGQYDWSNSLYDLYQLDYNTSYFVTATMNEAYGPNWNRLWKPWNER